MKCFQIHLVANRVDQLDVLPGPFMMLPFKVAFISHRFLINWIYCSVYYILHVIYYAMYLFENEKKKKPLSFANLL